jgi:hypothetical protein
MFNLTTTKNFLNAIASGEKEMGYFGGFGKPERVAASLDAQVEAISAAVAEGRITKISFDEIKSKLNNILELLRAGARGTESTFIDETFSSHYINHLNGTIKKLSAFKGVKSAHLIEVIEVLKDFGVLVDAFHGLKDKVVTSRQVRDAKAEVATSLKKALLSKVDVATATSAIADFVAKINDELVTSLTNNLRRAIARISDAVDSLDGKAILRKEYETLVGFDMMTAQSVLKSEVVGKNRYSTTESRVYTMLPKADIEAFITKEVEYNRAQIVGHFQAKLTDKTAQILSEKGNLKSVTVVEYTVRSGIIESDINYEFNDGSKFSINLQIVWVRNSNNTTFYRTPLRFYNVKYMADGALVTMKQPTEEKMYEFFK